VIKLLDEAVCKIVHVELQVEEERRRHEIELKNQRDRLRAREVVLKGRLAKARNDLRREILLQRRQQN
jgi:hypothetical protein